MKSPTLSVVMPNYNHARYLPEALQALLDQSYRPLEIIVMDDCSTDNSVEIIQGFARKDPLIRLVQNERNMGVLPTVNRLIKVASGDYVCSTAADDLLLPGMLEKSMRLLARYPQAGLCSTISKVVDANTERQTNLAPLKCISEHESYIPPDKALQWLRRRDSWIMGNTCVYRRAALLEAGGFVPELLSFCDGFIQMALALKHGACFIPEPLAVWRVSPTGFAVQSESNLQTSLKIWSHAAHLMRTTYADLFPPDYVDTWERQQLFRARLSALKRTHKEQMVIVRGFQENQSLIDRGFNAGVQSIMRLQFLTLLGLLLLRFGRGIWPILRRGINTAFQRWMIESRNQRIPTQGGQERIESVR